MRTRNILATMVFSLFILIVGARFGLTEPKLRRGGGGDIPQFSINGQPLHGQIDISTGSNLSYMQWSKDGVTHIRVNMREDDVRKMVDEEIVKWVKAGNSTSTH
jgi:hypothetical protein